MREYHKWNSCPYCKRGAGVYWEHGAWWLPSEDAFKRLCCHCDGVWLESKPISKRQFFLSAGLRWMANGLERLVYGGIVE